jgi:hypothetical protein
MPSPNRVPLRNSNFDVSPSRPSVGIVPGLSYLTCLALIFSAVPALQLLCFIFLFVLSIISVVQHRSIFQTKHSGSTIGCLTLPINFIIASSMARSLRAIIYIGMYVGWPAALSQSVHVIPAPHHGDPITLSNGSPVNPTAWTILNIFIFAPALYFTTNGLTYLADSFGIAREARRNKPAAPPPPQSPAI